MKKVGHIYFIRCGEFVKIGFSTDYTSRIRAIEANTPHDVVLEALHDGTQADERAFHKLLAAHRHKFEWFIWNDEVRSAANRGLDNWTKIHPRTPLDDARDVVGGDAPLARRLGITPQALSQWDRVPPLRVLEVERITGIPRHELRPDIYPASEPAGAA